MAQEVISGIVGNANLGAYGGGRLNRWEATYSVDALDATGFGSVWRQRIVGMQDLQGRVVGYLTQGTTTDNPGIPSGATTLPTTAIVSLMASSTSGITATVIISNVRITSDQNNTTTASRIEFDFMNAGAAVIVTWNSTT